MQTPEGTAAALRIGIFGAALSSFGILLSGPVGLIVVSAVHPPGSWEGAAIFAGRYHPIQTFPYFCGFALVAGYVALIAALHRIADERAQTRTLISVVCTAAFATLIFFNYICQTTFIPALASHYRPEYDAMIGTFSFANPRSLSWSIEMWGYALFGAATWLASPVFGRNGVERATKYLMIANGFISIASGIASSIDLGVVMTLPGFVGYLVWNGLMFAASICAWVSFAKRKAALA